MAELADTPHGAMIQEIEEEARATATYTGRPAFARRVMAAMAKVKREAFVSASQQGVAYVNGPLPIGYGQTISQPYIVALMTDLINPEPDHVVLEIGTGSGYQAAILAELVRAVYSIEVVPELADEAAQRLQRLGYGNVHVRSGDGNAGWPEHAPYDGILVTAAGPKVPPALVEQLKPGGRMVIPVGSWPHGQELTIVDKDETGKVRERGILPVAFVPLVEEIYRKPGR
jgi:protein-L-isoaspartate(D-aspartate) O-methyltransferase